MSSLFASTKKTNAADLKKRSVGLFSSRGPSLVVISMDENYIKLAHVKGKFPQAKISFLWSQSISGLDDSQVLDLLKNLIQENNLNPASCLISHPSHLTRARALRLPSVNYEELKTMVDLQVEKHTPDAKEDTLTYFRTLDSDAQGYSNVLLVLAHQDSVSRSARMVQKLGGRSTAVGSDIEGLISWYNLVQKSEKDPFEGGTLLIDFDIEYASLLIIHGKEAYYHRTIPLKIETLLQDTSGEVLSQFLADVHRSLLAFEEEGFKSPCSRLILTGQAVKLLASRERIQNEMKLPTSILPVSTGFTLSESSAQYVESSTSVSFASLLGFISGQVLGDLTPSAMRVRQTFEGKVKAASLLGAQVLLGLLLVCGFMLFQIHQDMVYKAVLQTQTDKLEKPASELEVTLEHLKIVRNELDRHGVLLESLVTIKAVTPPEVQWNSMNYSQGESIAIKGVSRQIAKVFEMVTALEKSPLFIKPEARRVTKRKVDNKDVTDFELILPFAGAE